MSLESFIKKTFKAAGDGLENIRAEREKRLKDPAFQKELMESRNEFAKHLTNTGSHALDTCYHTVLAVGKLAWYGGLSAIQKKQTWDDAKDKSLDELTTAGGHFLKTGLNALRGAGRLTVHTLRWITAK
jgi:hypothetical protein